MPPWVATGSQATTGPQEGVPEVASHDFLDPLAFRSVGLKAVTVARKSVTGICDDIRSFSDGLRYGFLHICSRIHKRSYCERRYRAFSNIFAMPRCSLPKYLTLQPCAYRKLSSFSVAAVHDAPNVHIFASSLNPGFHSGSPEQFWPEEVEDEYRARQSLHATECHGCRACGNPWIKGARFDS
ncbi:hypothetical protein SAMN04488082_10418 [Desulfomicrobium apsheronum]|uniref:Uncharacterized protein n=1 Tax=Desulfomicrobium apsheronum TaxID=52560 RepID=A0A1I3S469_9BACT|nr:hypothetical protein SAMN04488082_10418 [Desulfomicrobium apsheronum]